MTNFSIVEIKVTAWHCPVWDAIFCATESSEKPHKPIISSNLEHCLVVQKQLSRNFNIFEIIVPQLTLIFALFKFLEF